MLDIDQAVHEAFNARAVPGYDQFFGTVTQLGNAFLWAAVLAIYLLFGRRKLIAVILLITLFSSMIVDDDIKEIVGRNRPDNAMVGSYFTHHYYSFPSGHTETAFIMATVLSAFVALRYRLILYLLAAAVGASRLYLGVHYFTDVLGGAVTGFIIGGMAIIVMYRMGLIQGNKMAENICNALKIEVYGTPSESYTIKNIAIYIFGLAAALALLLAGEYILSVAALSFAYIWSLWGMNHTRKAGDT